MFGIGRRANVSLASPRVNHAYKLHVWCDLSWKHITSLNMVSCVVWPLRVFLCEPHGMHRQLPNGTGHGHCSIASVLCSMCHWRVHLVTTRVGRLSLAAPSSSS